MSGSEHDRLFARISAWCFLHNKQVFIPRKGPVKIEGKMYEDGVAVIYLVSRPSDATFWNPSRDGWELFASTYNDGTSYAVYTKARRKLSKNDKETVAQYGRPPKGWRWPRECLALA